jgi:hypothetical protein
MACYFHAAGNEGGSGGGYEAVDVGNEPGGADDKIGENSGGTKLAHTS